VSVVRFGHRLGGLSTVRFDGEFAKAPVAACRVSESDAEHLEAAFNITTVADLGTTGQGVS
jgi:hypothetical protein